MICVMQLSYRVVLVQYERMALHAGGAHTLVVVASLLLVCGRSLYSSGLDKAFQYNLQWHSINL